MDIIDLLVSPERENPTFLLGHRPVEQRKAHAF